MNLMFVCFWVALAMAFAVMLHFVAGPDASYSFMSAYLVEKSLSVDNLFVFSLIFNLFAVSPRMQQRLLSWGIIGAILFRGILIFSGSALVTRFHWVLYVFGALLILTSIKILRADSEPGGSSGELGGPERLTRFIQQFGLNRFLTCLLVVELSDVWFALDSIPATLSITQEPLIILSANVFAILGLRSLYFVLLDMLERFENLKYGVSVVLLFIGAKMLLASILEISTGLSLAITVLILAASMFTSQFQRKVPVDAE